MLAGKADVNVLSLVFGLALLVTAAFRCGSRRIPKARTFAWILSLPGSASMTACRPRPVRRFITCSAWGGAFS